MRGQIMTVTDHGGAMTWLYAPVEHVLFRVYRLSNGQFRLQAIDSRRFGAKVFTAFKPQCDIEIPDSIVAFVSVMAARHEVTLDEKEALETEPFLDRIYEMKRELDALERTDFELEGVGVQNQHEVGKRVTALFGAWLEHKR